MKYAKLTEIFSKGRAMSENKSDYKAKEAEKFSLKTLEAEFMDENEEGLLKLSKKRQERNKRQGRNKRYKRQRRH